MFPVTRIVVVAVLVLGASMDVRAQTPAPALPAKALTEIQELKVKVLELQIQNAQLQASLSKALTEALGFEAQLQSVQLTAAQKALSDELVTALGGSVTRGDSFDFKARALKRAGPTEPRK